MSQLDPEGAEPRALFAAASFDHARVVEIGSGSGRLAFRYAHRTDRVVGVELSAAELASAVRDRPMRVGGRVRFVRADAAALPFGAETFDVAVFAWSL